MYDTDDCDAYCDVLGNDAYLYGAPVLVHLHQAKDAASHGRAIASFLKRMPAPF